MKKICTLFVTAFTVFICSQNSNASTVIVNVEDFEFTPSSFTISLGDTVMWMWDNSAGAHTTTSTLIPDGAVAWDQQINQTSQMFVYVPAIAGSYDYVCTFHAAMGMVGYFTVIGSTGIAPNTSAPAMQLTATNPVSNVLQLSYTIGRTTAFSIRMYNTIGAQVFRFISATQNAGIYTQTFDVGSLNKGVYVIDLETPEGRLSQKVFLQ